MYISTPYHFLQCFLMFSHFRAVSVQSNPFLTGFSAPQQTTTILHVFILLSDLLVSTLPYKEFDWLIGDHGIFRFPFQTHFFPKGNIVKKTLYCFVYIALLFTFLQIETETVIFVLILFLLAVLCFHN